MGNAESIPPQDVRPAWLSGADNGSGDLNRAVLSRAHRGEESEFNLGALWRIFYHWRWLILGATLTSLGVAILVTLLATPLYRASTVLEINPPRVEIFDESMKQAAPNEANFLRTQYGLLASRNLAERVVQDLNLANNALIVPQEIGRRARQAAATDLLIQNLDIEPLPGSNLVKVSFISDSPQTVAAVVNGFATNFINSNLERRHEAASYASDFLGKQISTVRTDLEASERQLAAYAQSQGIINSEGDAGQETDGGSLTGASLVALNGSLAGVTAKRIAAEQRYRQSRAVGQTTDVATSTSALRAQRAALEGEYLEKRSTFRPDYPDMVRLRDKINSLNREIQNESQTISQGRDNSLLSEYRAAAAEEQELQARVNQLKSVTLAARGRGVQYTILQREVDTKRSLYDALLKRFEEIDVGSGVGTNHISVVDVAEVPTAPYRPSLPFNLLIGLGVGLALAIGLALAFEFITDTIKTPEDVERKLSLPRFGSIPLIRKGEQTVDALGDQGSPLSEAYFSLRTALQFTTEEGAPKTLLISSTQPSEGKSNTAFALARDFARGGKTVLLIDADLREPTFVESAHSDLGLTRLLTTDERVRSNVSPTKVRNLSLLPSGPIPPNPAELLGGTRLGEIIDQASGEYDMVIVDGPPVLGLADSPLLGAACQRTLFVIESGKVRTKAARDAINRLRAAGSTVLGATITKYDHQTGYGYYPYIYKGQHSDSETIMKLIAVDRV